MSANIGKRKRKVDINLLTDDQAEMVGEALAKKVQTLSDKVVKEIDEILGIYGIKSQIAIQLIEKKTGKVIT